MYLDFLQRRYKFLDHNNLAKCNPRRRWRKLLEADRQGLLWGTERHHGRADGPHLDASRGPLRCGIFWCPLESSGVVFVAVKFGSFLCFDPPS
jgi:hypothetical protein